VFRFRELGIVLALAIVAVTAVNNSNFVSATNLQQIVEARRSSACSRSARRW
jgi:hypothetical protein